MRSLGTKAIETARVRGASYADIRLIHTRNEDIQLKNGQVGSLIQGETLGYGIRVIANGAWGFASSNVMTAEAAEKTAALAVSIAKASALTKKEDVRLSKDKVYQDIWTTPYQIDPFKISLGTKMDLLYQIDEILRKSPKIMVAESYMSFINERQFFFSTEGADIEQNLLRSGCGYSCTSVADGVIESRSFPTSFGGNYITAGYETILATPLVENAERIREEAVALLTAAPCPPGRRTLILDSTQMALQIHESCGHASELDRVLGMEANYAGVSFLTTEKKGNFKYGSPLVNLVADMTYPGGLATCGYDDDGVRVDRFHVVKNGIFQTYFTSRELAHRIDEEYSRGCSRADGYNNIPIIRIPNLSLMPGDHTLEQMIEETEDGVLFEVNKSWSIDQWRMNFQFATEIGWEIKKGKKTRMLRNCTYQGVTPEFWGSCDAIGNRDTWQLIGVPNCGKGQPGQRAEMSHGSSPTRFQNVMVGVGNE